MQRGSAALFFVNSILLIVQAAYNPGLAVPVSYIHPVAINVLLQILSLPQSTITLQVFLQYSLECNY